MNSTINLLLENAPQMLWGAVTTFKLWLTASVLGLGAGSIIGSICRQSATHQSSLTNIELYNIRFTWHTILCSTFDCIFCFTRATWSQLISICRWCPCTWPMLGRLRLANNSCRYKLYI